MLFSSDNYDIYEYDVADIDVIFSYDGFYTEPGMAKACKYKIARISEILANDLYIWGLKKGPLKTFQGEFKGIGYYPALLEIILKKDQLDHIRGYRKINYDPVVLKNYWKKSIRSMNNSPYYLPSIFYIFFYLTKTRIMIDIGIFFVPMSLSDFLTKGERMKNENMSTFCSGNRFFN